MRDLAKTGQDWPRLTIVQRQFHTKTTDIKTQFKYNMDNKGRRKN